MSLKGVVNVVVAVLVLIVIHVLVLVVIHVLVLSRAYQEAMGQ